MFLCGFQIEVRCREKTLGRGGKEGGPERTRSVDYVILSVCYSSHTLLHLSLSLSLRSVSLPLSVSQAHTTDYIMLVPTPACAAAEQNKSTLPAENTATEAHWEWAECV